jgi:hypothetical protein
MMRSDPVRQRTGQTYFRLFRKSTGFFCRVFNHFCIFCEPALLSSLTGLTVINHQGETTMNKRITSIMIMGILAAVSGLTAWIPLQHDAEFRQPSDVRVHSSDFSGTTLDVRIPGVFVTEEIEIGQVFSKISIPDTGVLSRPGSPLVPAIRKNIIVPRNARVNLHVSVTTEQKFKDYLLIPAQPSYLRTEDKPPFTLDEKVYGNNALYPREWARITDGGFLRDFRFVTVTITPVRTNPVTGELVIATGLQVDIVTEGDMDFGCESVFPSFRDVYRNAMANFQPLEFGTRMDPEPMLIICHDGFLGDMASFVEWKTKRGIDVTMVSSTETGTTSTEIQSYIQDVWATWDPQPVFILLVGDAPQLQPLTGIGSCPSDSLFTLLEGSDLYPDVFISRLSALNTTELNAQLDKILTYEINPPDAIWLDRFAGLASSEGSGPSDEEYSQEIEARFLAHNPDAVADRIYQSMGHGPAQISAAVNEGRFWLSYLGHGSGTSWSAPSFSNSDVDALTNGYFTPFIMDVSCSNGGFTGSSDCFAERWLKNTAKGAVGMFSSSTSCSWHEPAVLAWGVTYSVTGNTGGTIPGGQYHFGQMTYNGYIHMFDVFGTGSNTEEVLHQYVLFGDCSAMFRSDAFTTLEVDHLPTAPMAPVPFTVTVNSAGSPVDGAFVCAFKPGEVHVVAETDDLGIAVLNIAPESIGDMIITVYGQNLYPSESIVAVAPAGCGVVVMDRSGYNCDDTIEIRVFDSDLNADPLVIETTEVQIHSDSDPIPQVIELVETGPDTAIFSGTVLTSDSSSGPGILLVSHGDTITVHYHDEDCDGLPQDVYAYADVDCEVPVISNVAVSDIQLHQATISWTTNEIADSVLYWGDTLPPANSAENTKLVTDHSFTLKDLDVCTEYFFYVQSTDPHGNVAIDDNGGAYYAFTTLQLMVLLEETMDTDPGWTYENLWEWGPASGAGGNPPSGHTGTHIVGYNLTGNYQNSLPVAYMTTTPFDCSSASQAYLGFWRWLGVESATWDHASIEISNDGGTSWDVVWEHTGGTLQETQWSYQEYDITDWAAGYGDVRLRWGMGPSDSVYAFCGWNIDDVLVSYTAPCNVPLLVHGDHTIDDSAGNNDGWINGGETIAMTVTLNNVGLDATNVSGTLSTTNPNVTITNPSVTFPDIPQSGSGTSLDAFVFDVDPSAGDGEMIPFTLAWTSAENSGSTTFSEMVVAPSLMVYEYQIEEISGGTFNGIWEPGETIDVHVTVKNTGAGTGYDISGVLSSNLPAYVTIETGTASWPDIPGGGSAVSEAPHFRVTAAPDTPDPSDVLFTVDFTAEGYTGQSDFTIECTFSNFVRRYHWNMDTDPEWTTEDQWAWGEPAGLGGDPSSGYTGTNVYGYNLMGTYTNYMPETNLTTGPIDCMGFQDVEVRFMRWLGIESSQYDHAYFRVSNDGVNWTTIWSHTGSTFTDPDWQEIAYDISAVADNEPAVYLRWVMGTTDVSVVYCGWNIDDVEIWADIYEAPPTATPTVPPTATPAPPTHTPTPDCIHHGDVNFDGVISAADAQLAFMITLGMYSPTYEEECAADCNGDGVVSAADAQLIFLTAIGSGNCVDPL